MNIATMVFVTSANDILTELLNNPKLKDYKPYLLEIGSHISQINKKVKRTYKNNYDDVICNITDEADKYLRQLDNYYHRKFITAIEYDKLDVGVRIILLTILIDYAFSFYLKTQNDKNFFKSDFSELVKANIRFINSYQCMFDNHKEYTLNDEYSDTILKNMMDCIRIRIVEFNRNNHSIVKNN